MKIILAILFVSYGILTAKSFELRCFPQDPCKFADDLGYCIGKDHDFKIFDEGGATIKRIAPFSTNDFLRTPAPIKLIDVEISSDLKSINVYNLNGDGSIGEDSIFLTSEDTLYYQGSLTVEEDFSFDINCTEISLTYEPKGGIGN